MHQHLINVRALSDARFRLGAKLGEVLCARPHATLDSAAPLATLPPMATTEPKPCKRYSKRAPWNAKFLAHLPHCDACKAVMLYLRRQSQMDLFRRRHRN